MSVARRNSDVYRSAAKKFGWIDDVGESSPRNRWRQNSSSDDSDFGTPSQTLSSERMERRTPKGRAGTRKPRPGSGGQNSKKANYPYAMSPVTRTKGRAISAHHARRPVKQRNVQQEKSPPGKKEKSPPGKKEKPALQNTPVRQDAPGRQEAPVNKGAPVRQDAPGRQEAPVNKGAESQEARRNAIKPFDLNTIPTQRVIISDADKLYPGECLYKGLICTATLCMKKHKIKVCRGNAASFIGDAVVRCTRELEESEPINGSDDEDPNLLASGGIQLKEALDKLPAVDRQKNKVHVGSATMTTSGDLACNMLIHAAGPAYLDKTTSQRQNDDLLRSAYTSSLQYCSSNELRSVAFHILCANQAGGSRPLEVISKIGWDVCVNFLKKYDGPRLTICFVARSEKESILLRAVVRETKPEKPPMKMRMMPYLYK